MVGQHTENARAGLYARDIGGFFIRNDPSLWFWRGDYDAGCRGLTPASAI